MTRDKAIDTLLARLHRRGDTGLRDALVLELHLAQQRLEQGPVYPWFLLTETASTQTAAGEERVPLPSDFLREAEDDALWVEDGGVLKPLVKDDLDALRASSTYGQGKTGIPQRYATLGAYFHLFPVPDGAYTIKMKYYKRDEDFSGVAYGSGTSENQWLKYAPDLVMAECGFYVAEAYLRDSEMVQAFRAWRDQEVDRLWRMNEGRQHVNRDYRMGD